MSSISFVEESKNLNISPERLSILAIDKNWDVRCGVAENPNTPHYIKKYLKIQEQLARL
jgi:hypothetical protein